MTSMLLCSLSGKEEWTYCFLDLQSFSEGCFRAMVSISWADGYYKTLGRCMLSYTFRQNFRAVLKSNPFLCSHTEVTLDPHSKTWCALVWGLHHATVWFGSFRPTPHGFPVLLLTNPFLLHHSFHFNYQWGLTGLKQFYHTLYQQLTTGTNKYCYV